MNISAGKFGAALTVLATTALLVVAPAAPASAAVSGNVTISSGILYDDCRDIPVPYSLAVTPDVDHWSMDIVAYGPDGTEESSAFVASSFNPASGTETILFCGSELAGRYELRTTGTWDDYDAEVYDQPFSLPTVTFTMRDPKSKTGLKTQPAGKGKVRVIISVRDERPNGYFATDFAEVKLQKFVSGRWVGVAHSKGYTDDGRYVQVYTRPDRPLKVRAVTAKDDSYSASKSPGVKIYP